MQDPSPPVSLHARAPARLVNVLLLEPWYGGSHRRFADGLAAHSRHDVRAVTMAARAGRWRMQGGAVTLAAKAREATGAPAGATAGAHAGGWTPDLIVATDRVNLPAFLALTRDRFARVPVLLYLHGNALTRPPRDPDAPRDPAYAVLNVLSMLAADRVAFNSQFHRDTFFEALPGLFAHFPDDSPAGQMPALLAKSTVLRPGVDLAALDAAEPARATAARGPTVGGSQAGPPVILWNHRREPDQDPEAFFRVLNRLDDVGARFRLSLAGETPAGTPAGTPAAAPPPAFADAVRRYAGRVLHDGVAETFGDYAALLWRSDLVVSTARYELSGLSALEAVHCGCHPLLPDRLAFPELVPESLRRPLLHAPVLYDSEDDLFATLRRLLGGADPPLPPDVLRRIPDALAWPVHVARFDALFEEMGDGRNGRRPSAAG